MAMHEVKWTTSIPPPILKLDTLYIIHCDQFCLRKGTKVYLTIVAEVTILMVTYGGELWVGE